MTRPTKASKRKRDNLSKARHSIKLQKMWQERLSEFSGFDLANPMGRCRTEPENKLVLLTLKLVLELYLEKMANKEIAAHELSWTLIENRVADGLHMRRDYITKLRQLLYEENAVGVFGDEEEKTRGKGSPVSKAVNAGNKLTQEQLQALVKEVDECHSNGSTVNCTIMKNFLNNKFKVDIHETTIGSYLKKVGLSYKPVKAKKRNLGAYRMDLLRDYLLEFNDLYKIYKEDPENCPFVFVYTGESYIHKGLGSTNSWTKSDSIINKSASKGTRLIMIHAITPNGPLCEREDNNKPVDDLEWKGDTCHPKNRTDKLTCEAMWKAESHTGDYHDNMNSDNFSKWVDLKLIPTFEKLHPNKQMILICDNAPYHHKRRIGSLSSKSKAQLLKLGKDHDIEYIDLPLTVERLSAISDMGDMMEDVQYLNDDYCRVLFDVNKFKQRSGLNKPFVPSLEELKVGLITYIKNNKPELLECQIEKTLKERGHRILWTPPYSPDLQPIELFWAAGKNHARSFARNGITMKETVEYVREGWYGNLEEYDKDNNQFTYRRVRKEPTNCYSLFMHTINEANTKFIPICSGLKGIMGELEVDQDHVPNREGLPIDMLVLSLENLPDGREK
jgi:hypothetical protein